MFLILWEFEVKPGYEEQFEKVYGPEGDWAQLFRTDPNYQETRLLVDSSCARTYVTLDFWKAREAYEAFQQRRREDYAALDEKCEAFTVKERHIGSFE